MAKIEECMAAFREAGRRCREKSRGLGRPAGPWMNPFKDIKNLAASQAANYEIEDYPMLTVSHTQVHAATKFALETVIDATPQALADVIWKELYAMQPRAEEQAPEPECLPGPPPHEEDEARN